MPTLLLSQYAVSIGIALLETFVSILVIWALIRGFNRLIEWIRAEGRVREIRFRSLSLLSARNASETALKAVKGVRAVLLLLVIYAWFSGVLSAFPATREFGLWLVGLFRDALSSVWTGLTGFLPNLVEIAFIAILARYLIRVSRFLFDAIEKGRLRLDGFDSEWVRPTYQIVRFLIIVFAIVTIFPLLPGHESKALQGVTIFVGVLFSFASSSSVSNLIAGLILVYMRSFRIGDWIKSGETFGEVYERNLFVTRIRTVKNVEVTVPNAIILASHTENYSKPADQHGLILHTGVSIGYDVPWRKVHELLIEAAKKTTGIEATPEPFVLQQGLSDFFVSYEINAYTRQPGRIPATYSKLHQNIQDCFFAAGVEIMSPHYTSVRDGNMVAIPKDQRPDGYVAPPFRIKAGE